MRTAQQRLSFGWARVLALVLVWVNGPQPGLATVDALRYQAGIRNATGQFGLSAKQQRVLLQSLRAKTGWEQLEFDENGFLQCPEPAHFSGGSPAARTLLAAALRDRNVFELENHNHSKQVSFARLAVPVAFRSMATGKQLDVYPLQLDFSDLTRLRGEREAAAAFDSGLLVLHELAHGAWHLRDARFAAEEPGECETYINLIRRELGLPERLNYLARSIHLTLQAGHVAEPAAELVFVSQTGKHKKSYYLSWSIAEVGGVVVPHLPASVPALTALQE